MLSKYLNCLDDAINSIAQYNDKFNIDRFNQYQKPIIVQMLQNYVDEKHTILVAPTGAGKSIISLLYTYVITKVNNSRSLILASDTFLQQQYVESHNTFTKDIAKFAMLKGKSNYMCMQNAQPYTQGICAIRDISIRNAVDVMPCAKQCDYINAYYNAINSNICVLNYHLYMSYANYVGSHDLINDIDTFVFDECHKIDDILDNFANIKLNLKWLSVLHDAIDAVSVYAINALDYYRQYVDNCNAQWYEFVKIVLQGATNEALHNQYKLLLQTILSVMSNKEFVEVLKQITAKNDTSLIAQALINVKKLINKAAYMQFETENLESDKFVVAYNNNETSQFTISNIDTAHKFNNLILQKTNNRPIVLMSATVGNVDYYIKHLGLTNVDVIRMDSIFDFSKSPIVAVQPLISMSLANKDSNIVTLIDYIDRICEAHSNHNGIIHTSNKKLASIIVEQSKHSKRMLTYSNADEKKKVLAKLNSSSNYIIVAYSMEEGVDLKDDLCRFQIIAKLSWQYLGDLIVKRKIDYYPEWYSMTTLNTTLQTIGRGNRHIDDYCITYITDTSFTRIANSCDDVTKQRFSDMYYDVINKDFVNKTFKNE